MHESEVAQSCPTLSNPMDCSPPGFSVHGIIQARVLEWGAIAFSALCDSEGKILKAKVNMLRMAERASLVTQAVKNSPANAGDPGLTPGSKRSPGERNGTPLQYSCLKNPMDREAWQATVHGVAKSWTRLSLHAHTHTHTQGGRAERWKEAGSLTLLGRQTVQPQKEAQDSSPCDDICPLYLSPLSRGLHPCCTKYFNQYTTCAEKELPDKVDNKAKECAEREKQRGGNGYGVREGK